MGFYIVIDIMALHILPHHPMLCCIVTNHNTLNCFIMLHYIILYYSVFLLCVCIYIYICISLSHGLYFITFIVYHIITGTLERIAVDRC